MYSWVRKNVLNGCFIINIKLMFDKVKLIVYHISERSGFVANEFIRVNIKLPKAMHDYYKEKSERTGVPMSSLMYLDLEKVQEQDKAINAMGNVETLMELIKKQEQDK